MWFSTVPCCVCGDDLILYLLDNHSLQRATIILDEVFTNVGLYINVSNTETMNLNHILLEEEYPDPMISLCNKPLQNSSEFKYLSSYISQIEPHTEDIEINGRWPTENLLPWPTYFKSLRFTLKPESSYSLVLSAADSRTHALLEFNCGSIRKIGRYVL